MPCTAVQGVLVWRVFCRKRPERRIAGADSLQPFKASAFQSFNLRPSVRLKFRGLDLKTFSTGLPLSK